MNDFSSSYDYVVAQKPVGKWKWGRIGLITLYCVLPIALLIFIASGIGALLAPMFALAAVGEFVLIFFTWRFVKIEYEYVVTSGHLTFSVIQNAFNHRIRKEKMKMTLKSAEIIAPKTAEYEGKIAEFDPEIVYYALSSDDAPDRYFAIYKNDNGKRCAFYFEATEKMLKFCRSYNSNTVVTKVSH